MELELWRVFFLRLRAILVWSNGAGPSLTVTIPSDLFVVVFVVRACPAAPHLRFAIPELLEMHTNASAKGTLSDTYGNGEIR